MASSPQQSVERLFKGIAFTIIGLLILLTAGLYEWITDDDPAPAAATSPTTPGPGPAQMMADLDGNAYPVTTYQLLLSKWATKCTQDQATLAGYVHASLQDLQQNGIHSETEYTLLRQLNLSTPDRASTDCKAIAAAYLVLRESK